MTSCDLKLEEVFRTRAKQTAYYIFQAMLDCLKAVYLRCEAEALCGSRNRRRVFARRGNARWQLMRVPLGNKMKSWCDSSSMSVFEEVAHCRREALTCHAISTRNGSIKKRSSTVASSRSLVSAAVADLDALFNDY